MGLKKILNKLVDIKLVDILIMFSSIFSIIIFGWALYFSMVYWTSVFVEVKTVEAQMFWIGILASIVYTFSNFIIFFINGLAKTIKHFEKKEYE